MNIQFREPNSGDIGWIISMYGKVYAEEFGFDRQFELDIARKVVSFLENPSNFNLLLVAEIGGERAGSMAVSKSAEQVAFVNFVLVLKQFRGHGIAEKLVGHVIQRSRAAELKILRLETYSCLTSARKLYHKLGFSLVETKQNYCKYGQVFDREFWELNL